jgi:hypothetical protein
VCLYRNKQS